MRDVYVKEKLTVPEEIREGFMEEVVHLADAY